MPGDSAVGAALGIAPTWRGDVEEFVATLTEVRSRPTSVQFFPAPGTLFGAWLPTARADYIFLSDRLSGAHRDHVFMHEVGHMLMDHRVGLTESLTGIEPALAQRMLARHDHGSEQERQAELFASLVMTTGQSTAEWSGDPRGSRAATVFG